jgi:hypothetical protein
VVETVVVEDITEVVKVVEDIAEVVACGCRGSYRKFSGGGGGHNRGGIAGGGGR